MMQKLRNLWRFRWERSLLTSQGNPETLDFAVRRACSASWTLGPGLSPHSSLGSIGATRIPSRTPIPGPRTPSWPPESAFSIDWPGFQLAIHSRDNGSRTWRQPSPKKPTFASTNIPSSQAYIRDWTKLPIFLTRWNYTHCLDPNCRSKHSLFLPVNIIQQNQTFLSIQSKPLSTVSSRVILQHFPCTSLLVL
jgi:hypothetical protein